MKSCAKRGCVLEGIGAATSVAFVGVGAAQADSSPDAELGPEYEQPGHENPGCDNLSSCQECLDNNCFDCTDYC